VKVQGLSSKVDAVPITAQKSHTASVPSVLENTLEGKVVDNDTLEELMKDMKELKVEMSALKKGTRLGTSRAAEGSKEFVMRCIWSDVPNHRRGEWILC